MNQDPYIKKDGRFFPADRCRDAAPLNRRTPDPLAMMKTAIRAFWIGVFIVTVYHVLWRLLRNAWLADPAMFGWNLIWNVPGMLFAAASQPWTTPLLNNLVSVSSSTGPFWGNILSLTSVAVGFGLNVAILSAVGSLACWFTRNRLSLEKDS